MAMDDDATRPAEHDAPPPKRRRWLRRLVVGLAALILLAGALIALTPTILGTAWGTSFVVGRINASIPGRVEIQDLSLGWTGGQQLVGLRLLDPQGQVVLNTETLALPDASLWSLIWGGRDLGEIALESPQLDLVQYEDGTTNLARAMGTAEPGQPDEQKDEQADEPADDQRGILPADLSLGLRVTDGRVHYQAPQMQPVVASIPEATVTIAGPADIRLAAEALVQQGEDRGSLTARGEVLRLFDDAGRLDFEGADVDVQAAAENLPVPAIDRLMQMDRPLALLLGPTLSATASASGQASNMAIALTASSANAKADLSAQVQPEQVVMNDAGSVVLTLEPAAFAAWTDSPATLQAPVRIQLRISDLVAPLQDGQPVLTQARGQVQFSVEDAQLDVPQIGQVAVRGTSGQASLQAGQLNASASTTIAQQGQAGSLQLNARAADLFNAQGDLALADARIEQATLTARDLPLDVIDRIMGMDGRLASLLGQQLQATVEASGQMEDLDARLTARSANFSAALALQGTPQALSLREPAQARLTVTPQAWRQLMPPTEQGQPQVAPQGPVTVALNVPTLRVPLQDGQPVIGQLALSANLDVEPMALNVPDVGNVQLTQTQGAISTDALRQGLKARLQANTTINRQQGSATLEVDATDLLDAEDAFAADAWQARYQLEARDLPMVAALDQMLGQGGTLVTALGSTLSGQAGGTYAAARGGGPIQADLRSPLSRVQLTGAFSEEQISVENATIEATLTPELWRQLTRPKEPGAAPPTLSLAQPAPLTLRVENATIPRPMVPARTAIRARLTAQPMVFQQQAGGRVGVTDLDVNFSAPALDRPITLKASANVGQPGQEKAGGLQSNTQLSLGWTADGSPDLASTTLQTQTQINQLPTALIDQVAQANLRLEPILGPTASLSLNGSYPGAIDLKAQSPTAQASVVGTINEQRQLILSEDLTAQLFITPAMVAELLGRMHPMFQDAVGSETPVRFVLDKSSGAIPLTGLDLSKLTLSGTLDAGTVRMKRGGWLDETVFLVTNQLIGAIGLRQAPRNRLAVETYPATFTPMTFQLDNGILQTPQVWVTSSDLAIGFVGSVDLTTPGAPRIKKMTMGLLEASLIVEAPRLRKYIQADQIAELPLSGLVSSPEYDYQTLVADLVGSGLVQTARERGGEVGQILGGLFETVGQAEKQRRQRAAGVSWNLPPAAQQLIQKARAIDQPAPQPTTATQPADQQQPLNQPAQQQPAEPQPKQREPRPEDILGGLLNQILQGEQQKQDPKQ